MRVRIEDAAKVMGADPSVIYRKANANKHRLTKQHKYIELDWLSEILRFDSHMLAALARRKPKTSAEQELKNLIIKSCEE